MVSVRISEILNESSGYIDLNSEKNFGSKYGATVGIMAMLIFPLTSPFSEETSSLILFS